MRRILYTGKLVSLTDEQRKGLRHILEQTRKCGGIDRDIGRPHNWLKDNHAARERLIASRRPAEVILHKRLVALFGKETAEKIGVGE